MYRFEDFATYLCTKSCQQKQDLIIRKLASGPKEYREIHSCGDSWKSLAEVEDLVRRGVIVETHRGTSSDSNNIYRLAGS